MPYRFTFIIDNEVRYTALLHGTRCTHINPNNRRRCTRKVYIGINLCWQHDRTDLKLKIAPSTIPNAGKGLFAFDNRKKNNRRNRTVIFNAGTTICQYNGEIVTREILDNRYGDMTAPYGIRINASRNQYEDGAKYRGIGTLSNTNDDNDINAEFRIRNGRVVLIANKAIYDGDEIFANYMNDYNLNEEGVSYNTKYVKK